MVSCGRIEWYKVRGRGGEKLEGKERDKDQDENVHVE